MPIYEYKCPSCSKVFEEWVKEHDTAPKPCQNCGAMSPHIVSNTTFVLKGGGWYVTEYGNRKSESKSSASSDSAGASSGKPADSSAAPAEAGSPSAAAPVPATPVASESAASAA